MQKNYFEILLEEMNHNFKLAFEGLNGNNQRLDGVIQRMDRFESQQTGMTQHLDKLALKVDRLESGQDEIRQDVGVLKQDVREINQTLGILVPISKSQESRLQRVEYTLQDHLKNHS